MAENDSGSQTPTPSLTYFLSHSSGDDGLVRQLRIALADLDTPLTIDSRAFHGGDPLESTIRTRSPARPASSSSFRRAPISPVGSARS